MNTIQNFKEFLDTDTPFVFAKFGDGELGCMNGAKGCNCDRHPYSEDLSDKLKTSLFGLTSRPNTYIADWNETGGGLFATIRNRHINHEKFNPDNLVEYNSLLSNPANFNDELRELYRSIRKCSERKKIIMIVPARLNGVRDYIAPNAELINVPLVNAFSIYDKILSEVLNKVEEDSIVITSCGMMAKSLIWKIVESHPSVTCLDFGSAFDPVMIPNKTRLGQADHNTAKAFFKSI